MARPASLPTGDAIRAVLPPETIDTLVDQGRNLDANAAVAYAEAMQLKEEP